MKTTPISHAFEVTEDDIETVLRNNSLKVVNTRGLSFESMAVTLMPVLDMDAIALAALNADDVDQQTELAHTEIHRQLWRDGVIECAPQRFIDDECRPIIRLRLTINFAKQDSFRLQGLARAGFKGLDNMNDRELACEAARLGQFEALHEQFSALGVGQPPYIHGNWTHLFGPGSTDTNLRIVFDTNRNALIAGQFSTNGKWVDLRRDDLLDVEDSLKNANPESLERPGDAGLEASYHLPEWAQVTDGEEDTPRREAQRG